MKAIETIAAKVRSGGRIDRAEALDLYLNAEKEAFLERG